MKPTTQYTKSGSLNIAYQVFGSGSVDLVYIPGWVSNIDWMWNCPELVDFLQELGKISRVILFDKRGTGLSDRVVELSTLEERMDDIRAVMDAVGSKKAVLFGHSEGGSVSALFAATYPNRTISLITFGIFARRRYSEHYPWAPTDEERQGVYDMIENSWGSGDMNLESLAPSKANDKEFMDWLANYLRSGASPSAAMVLTKMNTEVDIIDILGSIKVPTLIMQRTHDIDVKIEEGKFIADHIHGAKFVEFDGNDHLFWVGNTKEVLSQMKAFILNVKPIRNYEEQLYTIVAARITNPSESERSKSLIDQYVTQYRGVMVRYAKDMFVAAFEGPSKAVHCSIELIDALNAMGVQLAIGIHIREVAVEEIHFISSKTELYIQALLDQANPNQVLATETIKFLLSGAGLHITPFTSILNPNTREVLSLFDIKDSARMDEALVSNERSIQHSKNDSFLEDVLQHIDANMDNELFGVESLCAEMGMSERQVQRKVKAITNKSPNQLIASVRLHRAKQLLLENTYNISEVAYQTGFSNPSYFSKSFKKEFGLTPSSLLK
jgi:pimeloyl-ACP methyl ester carboxylesterase/AraC-like DNA-binding protein